MSRLSRKHNGPVISCIVWLRECESALQAYWMLDEMIIAGELQEPSKKVWVQPGHCETATICRDSAVATSEAISVAIFPDYHDCTAADLTAKL